jgi:hypothetical protein
MEKNPGSNPLSSPPDSRMTSRMFQTLTPTPSTGETFTLVGALPVFFMSNSCLSMNNSAGLAD